jgi:hypothetical protein
MFRHHGELDAGKPISVKRYTRGYVLHAFSPNLDRRCALDRLGGDGGGFIVSVASWPALAKRWLGSIEAVIR